MKNTLVKSTSICAFLLIVWSFNIGCVFYKPTIQDCNIVGTWISEEDNNWRLVFTPELCFQYYFDALTETDSYNISNSSSQCGDTVSFNRHTRYLKLLNSEDATDIICYEINGIGAKTLSLSVAGRGGQLVFTRQE